MINVVTLRAFLFKGERIEPGTAVDLEEGFARELIAVGKVEPVSALVPTSGPMTTDTGTGLVSGRRKGPRNANA